MNSVARRWIALGALLGALGVGFGAFGAHGLPGFLEQLGYTGNDLTRRTDIFETAIRYQLVHAVALVAVGLALEMRAVAAWRFAAWAFFVGVLIFSGLLKVLAVAGPSWNWLGAIVPIGGVLMIVGWVAVMVGAVKE